MTQITPPSQQKNISQSFLAPATLRQNLSLAISAACCPTARYSIHGTSQCTSQYTTVQVESVYAPVNYGTNTVHYESSIVHNTILPDQCAEINRAQSTQVPSSAKYKHGAMRSQVARW